MGWSCSEYPDGKFRLWQSNLVHFGASGIGSYLGVQC